jgi:hypothetical protein
LEILVLKPHDTEDIGFSPLGSLSSQAFALILEIAVAELLKPTGNSAYRQL